MAPRGGGGHRPSTCGPCADAEKLRLEMQKLECIVKVTRLRS